MGKANGGTTKCHYKVFSNKFSNPYQPLVKGFRQDEGPGVGQGATEIWRKSIPVSFHFAWCLLLKSSNSPLTQISALKLEDALVRLAPVIASAVEFTKSGKRLKTGRDEDKCKQAGRATASTGINREERKTWCWGKKGKGSHKKQRGESWVSPVPALEGTQGPNQHGERQQEHQDTPPYPKEFRIRELLLCQPRKKDVTVGWTQYE